MKKYSSITLNRLKLSVNLGWPQGERVKQQIVTLNVTIRFKEPPVACTTDQLSDTYCYDDLVNTIKSHVATRNFRLLEHLGYEIYQVIKHSVRTALSVKILITKKPAILNLTGGVTFCYGDEE